MQKSFMKKVNGKTLEEQLAKKYLEKFADSYNELKDSAKNITDKELSKTLTKLESFMEENKKSLKKLGLKESKGKWIFDSEIMEDTKDKDINKLFEGNDAIFKQGNQEAQHQCHARYFAHQPQV